MSTVRARAEALMSRRAEKRSVSAPPTSKSAARGIPCAVNTMPRASAEPVSCRVSQLIAMKLKKSPPTDSAVASQNHLKPPMRAGASSRPTASTAATTTQRGQLAESLGPRQVFHPTVRREDEPLRFHEPQRVADPRRNGLDVLDRAVVCQVDHPDDQRLPAQALQDGQVDLMLSGLHRDLTRADVCKLLDERIAVRPRMDDVG